MIERYGDLFTTEAKHLGHGVNIQGKMGAGIAKTFREKFPDMYFHYRAQCHNQLLDVGQDFMFEENGLFIHNISSQEFTGRDAKYTWLQRGLVAAMENVEAVGGDLLALPEIGCGIGGLEWDNVKKFMLLAEENHPNVTLEVWHYV